MRTVWAAGPVRWDSVRAVTEAKIVVARPRRAPMSRRNPSGVIASTRDERAARTVRYGRWPVRRLTAPTNCPGPTTPTRGSA